MSQSAVKYYFQYAADTINDSHVFFKYLGADYPLPFYWMTLGSIKGSGGSIQWRSVYGTEDDAEDYPTNFFNYPVSGSYPDWVHWKSFFITQENDLLNDLEAAGHWRIPPGEWTFNFYLNDATSWGNCTAEVYQIRIDVYLYRGGDKTLIFSEFTSNVNASCDGVSHTPFIHTTAEQEGVEVESGDRLLVELYDQWNYNGYPYHRLLNFNLGPTVDNYFEMPATDSEDPPGGKIQMAAGWRVGNIEIKDGEYTMEVRSRSQHLQKQITELYSPDCRATLGDEKCGIDLEGSDAFVHDGIVESVTEDRLSFIDTTVDSSVDEDVFQFGLLTWSSAESGEEALNEGISIEVKSFNYLTGEFVLMEPMTYDINVGDQFTVTWGCNRSPDHCKNRFDNFINFRGDPYIPGYDQIKVETKE